MLWIILAWLACAAGTTWLHANSWPNTGEPLEYFQGAALGLVMGPIGLFCAFVCDHYTCVYGPISGSGVDEGRMTQRADGFAFRIERLRRGATQKQIGRLAGLDNTIISRYESGRLNLRAHELARLHAALESLPPVHAVEAWTVPGVATR